MRAPPPAPTPLTRLIVGAVLAIAGVILLAMTLGAIPVPEEAWEAPRMVAALCGIAFLLGGGIVASAPEPMAAPAPLPLRVAHHVSVLGFIAVIGAVMSWTAFGPGPREFEGEISLFGLWRIADNSEAGGRIGFGLIAALSVIVFIGAAVRAWRDLVGVPPSPR